MVFIDDIKKFQVLCSRKDEEHSYPPLEKTSEVFCVAEVVCTVFGKMSAVCSDVMVDCSLNNHLKYVEIETIKSRSRKRKGCFGWIRFLKRKKASTMQADNLKSRILLTA